MADGDVQMGFERLNLAFFSVRWWGGLGGKVIV